MLSLSTKVTANVLSVVCTVSLRHSVACHLKKFSASVAGPSAFKVFLVNLYANCVLNVGYTYKSEKNGLRKRIFVRSDLSKSPAAVQRDGKLFTVM
jgi:hypothetical protein